MRILIILVSLFLYCLPVSSQSIEGSINDPEKHPIPYANVLLKGTKDSLVKAGISNEDGMFFLKGFIPGKYTVEISALGFSPYTKSVQIDAKNVQLSTIILERDLEKLEEITIQAKKPLVVVEPDKTIFNVANSITATGNNSLEVLRKAPGVRVDNNNAISVEGKNGVLIYINDRQSYLQGEDLTAFLQSLQADEIETIEIITQPSSRYEAAGNAGIINIVMKRKKGMGTNGSISNTLIYGDFFRNNSQLGITHRSEKTDLMVTYNNTLGSSTSFINLFRIQGDKIFDARSNSNFDNNNHNLRTQMDYFINPKNTIGASVHFSYRDQENQSNSRTPISSRSTTVIDSILIAASRNDNISKNLNTNLNYRYKDTLGRNLTFDISYGIYSRDRFNDQPNFYSDADGTPLNENITAQDTPIAIDIYASSLDYEQKLGKGTITLGSKFSFVKTDNTFDFFIIQEGSPMLDVNRSNNFVYDEQIIAGYINYSIALKKWKIQSGLRMENTASKGDLMAMTTADNEVVSRNYTDWFPSGGLTYQMNRKNSFALLYSIRIQRPNYEDLNPFEYQLDELSFRRGNPFLQPQYTNNLKLSHTYNYKLTTSISYSYINDFFAQVTEAEGENRNFINRRNVADQEVYNLSISYPKRIKDWWNIYISASVNYSNYIPTNPAFLAIDQTTFGGYAQSTFTLPKEITLEVSGWYSGPSIWGGTYQTKSLGSLNVGVQKKWKNWTAKIAANDILYTIPWRGFTQFGDLSIDGNGGSDSRTIQLYLAHTFGHKDVKTRRKRKSSLEEEENRIKN